MNVSELYDEFGNYIGPDESDSEDSLQLPALHREDENGSSAALPEVAPATTAASPNGGLNGRAKSTGMTQSQAIVLAEDKQLYPTAEDVFGPDTEVMVEEEDAQPISEPLVEPIVDPSSGLHETEATIPPAYYNRSYLTEAIHPHPHLNRNIAIVGHLHHGKSSFVDMLFDTTHDMPWSNRDDRDLPVRYMDTRHDEQKLNLSIKANAATFLLQTTKEKSYAISVLDTPGHTNFQDEAIAALTLVDGVVVVVDVAEGVMLNTEVMLRKAAEMRLDIVLVLSKIDRLCVELRLPPSDAYHKIRYIIETCNDLISAFQIPKFSPAIGNVAFSSPGERVLFTLPQFAQAYIDANGGNDQFPLNARQLARRFWGDVYFDGETRKFTDKPTFDGKRTFVSFVLEPFYKLHTAVLSEDVDDLANCLKRNDLLVSSKRKNKSHMRGHVSRAMLDLSLKGMLSEVTRNSYGMGRTSGFTDMIVQFIRSPVDSARMKVESLCQPESSFNWDSERGDDYIDSLLACDTDSTKPLVAYVGKLTPDEWGVRFDCLLRVLSGRIKVGQRVAVLGPSYDGKTNREDMASATVDNIFVSCGRFKIEIQEAVAGQVVLVRGIDQTVHKSATVVSSQLVSKREVFAFKSIQSLVPSPVVKIAVEPIRPSELPKMVSSLRQCVNSYPGLVTKVEETGEHTLVGAGELYMDCVLRDLREAYSKIEIKLSDPVVPFAETVSETSMIQCFADSRNGQNKLVMIAEPLEDQIADALADGSIERSQDLPSTLRESGWDALAAKSLWTFGPDSARGPNALQNDVLIEDTRRKADLVRESVVQGFCWAMREGPLADEPVRGVKIRLLDTELAENAVSRSAAQLIPAARRVVYSSMLTAFPRMMEPIYLVEIVSPPAATEICYNLITRRRGLVISENDMAGTPLRRIMVHMPVLDSFGFEPDLRSFTRGSAFCLQVFDHWGTMPGDPLDKELKLQPLEVARRSELARECMVKTRRRKGLSDEVSVTKYFDDPLLVELAQDNEELRKLL